MLAVRPSVRRLGRRLFVRPWEALQLLSRRALLTLRPYVVVADGTGPARPLAAVYRATAATAGLAEAGLIGAAPMAARRVSPSPLRIGAVRAALDRLAAASTSAAASLAAVRLLPLSLY